MPSKADPKDTTAVEVKEQGNATKSLQNWLAWLCSPNHEATTHILMQLWTPLQK